MMTFEEKKIKKDKLKDLQFLKNFSKITIKGACKEENIKKNNVYTLKISKENLNRIKANIDNKINKLYEEYNENSTL